MFALTSYDKREILPYAQGFLEKAKEDLSVIGDRFFMLGLRLYEAQRYDYVEALGYESIDELAEKELDLGRSTTYNLIRIFERFCARDKNGCYQAWIKPEFRDYSYSKLVEMAKALCLSVDVQRQIPPQSSCRDIKEYVKYVNKNLGQCKDLLDWKKDVDKSILSVQTFGQNEEHVSLEEVTTEVSPIIAVAPVEEVVEVAPVQPSSTVQTFGLKAEDLITEEELTKLFADYCKMFDMRLHAITSDGMFLKCVPSGFSAFFYPDLAKFLDEKLKEISSYEKK